MTDTHCHLSFSQYDADREAVLNRAAIVGVTHIVNPGTDLAQSRAAVALARQRQVPTVVAGVGVHPQDIAGLTDETFREIEQLAADQAVVAIGEVGLEISSKQLPAIDIQEQWLARFVALARTLGKPLIFHVREAHAAFRMFLEQQESGIRGVVHCFSGTPDDALFYAGRGLFLGITGVVTFPNAGQLRRAVEDVPVEHLLLETDAPFLAPQARRGKRNEPAYLPDIAAKVAELKELTLSELTIITDANARRLFGLS